MIDLMQHSHRWHGRIVTVRIYPYDLGFGGSNEGWTYAVCFELCDRAYADRSPFLVRSNVAHFNGYTGDEPVIVRSTYQACNVDWLCADTWAGVFTETELVAE